MGATIECNEYKRRNLTLKKIIHIIYLFGVI